MSTVKIPKYDEKDAVSFLEIAKEKAQHDFLYLMTEILGYKYDPKRRIGITGLDPAHKKMISTMNSPERFKLMLIFRGAYKTTFMIGKCIQILINDPNATILLVTEAGEYSRKILRNVKRHLKYNRKLIELFGNFVPKTGKGSLYSWKWNLIDIAQRDPESEFTLPSIGTAGVDSEVTGQHPDWIIMDDIVGPKNITTVDQKFKVEEYVRQSIPLLGSTGRLIVVGTPWAYDDVYAYLCRNWVDELDYDGTPLFSFARMGIMDADGEPTLPSVYDRAQIAQLKAITSTFQWSCQYMCNPVDKDNVLFNRKDIIEYDELPLIERVQESYDVYITVDPAISLNPKKCWTGIIVGIPIKPNHLYIDDAIREKLLPADLIDRVMGLVDRYKDKVRAIGIEEASFQKIYAGSLINEIRRRMSENPTFKNVHVGPLTPNDNKHRRIYALEPYFRHHQMRVRAGLGDLTDQLYAYPHLSEHNLDLLDSLAYQLQLLPENVLHNPYGIINLRKQEEPKRVLGATYDEGLLEESNVVW
jgi:hypothetical protein